MTDSLIIRGVTLAQPAEAVVDPYVPLRVGWRHAYSVRPVYYRIEGENGGNLELKVDPETGTLLGIVIIGLPPARQSAWSLDEMQIESGLPTFDLSPWLSSDGRNAGSDVVRAKGDLWTEWAPLGLRIRLEKREADRWIDAGPIVLGVTETGALVAVEVRGNEGEQLRQVAGL